jgi:hypothetical protein
MVKLLPEMVIKWSENNVSSRLGLKISLRVIESAADGHVDRTSFRLLLVMQTIRAGSNEIC